MQFLMQQILLHAEQTMPQSICTDLSVFFCMKTWRYKPGSTSVLFYFVLLFYHAYMFIVLILPAYKWLPPFAADV